MSSKDGLLTPNSSSYLASSTFASLFSAPNIGLGSLALHFDLHNMESYASHESHHMPSHTSKQKPLNIIIFGKIGSGKSSVVNMLIGKDDAIVSDGADSCTFSTKAYDFTINHLEFCIHDTAGLNEEALEDGNARVCHTEALAKLYELVRQLEDGVSLLVYCVPKGRVANKEVAINWSVFHGVVCRREVPIILLITGCENGDISSDQWWESEDTTRHFRECRAYPNAAACITSTRGKLAETGHVYQKEYDQSKTKVQQLILQHYGVPWRLDRVKWLTVALREVMILGFLRTKQERIIRLREALELENIMKMDGGWREEQCNMLLDAFERVENDIEEIERGSTQEESKTARKARFWTGKWTPWLW